MSKMILVIDKQKNCIMCPLSFYNKHFDEYQCRGAEYYRTIPDYNKQWLYTEDIRPEWCPLLPMPEPKDLTKYTYSNDLADLFLYNHDQGYNDCLYDLNGGTLWKKSQ